MSGEPSESVFLSLGSNIDPEAHLVEAVHILARSLQLLAVSRVFETHAVGSPGGPKFLNAALRVQCQLTPRELKFEVLRPAESRLGRVRTTDRNAPRTIDIDISLFGNRTVNDLEARLEIPDPEILTRAHVAVPLADLAPRLAHPVTGERLAEIAARLRTPGGMRVREDMARRLPTREVL